MNATGTFEFSAQGPHTYASAPDLALAVAGGTVIVIDMQTLTWSTSQLHGCSGGLVASAIVATAADLSDGRAIPVLVGGHSRFGPYGPVVLSTTIDSTASPLSNSSSNCTVVFDFAASTTPGMSPMTVASLVVDLRSSGQTVVAGLEVGDYYDGDVPQHLWATADAGKDWRAVDAELPNAVVTSMAFAPDNRLCASSNGDGVACFRLGALQAAVPPPPPPEPTVKADDGRARLGDASVAKNRTPRGGPPKSVFDATAHGADSPGHADRTGGVRRAFIAAGAKGVEAVAAGATSSLISLGAVSPGNRRRAVGPTAHMKSDDLAAVVAVMAAIVIDIGTVEALDNGLGLTPPMDWRPWLPFKHEQSQEKMTAAADAMVSRKRGGVSLRDAGYEHIGLDDYWQACGTGVSGSSHNASGYPLVNTTLFPDSKAMNDHAHAVGLKTGWYGNNFHYGEGKLNVTSWGASPGGKGKTDGVKHYQGDVQAIIDFGFNGIKLDNCGQFLNMSLFAELMNATGRPIMVGECHWAVHVGSFRRALLYLYG